MVMNDDRRARPAVTKDVSIPHAVFSSHRLRLLRGLVGAWVLASACVSTNTGVKVLPQYETMLPGNAPSLEMIESALNSGVDYLMRRQHNDGYWRGVLYNDTSVTGMYILCAHYVNRVSAERQKKAVRYLLETQGADGGWEHYPGSDGNLDVTLVNYIALRVAGIPEQSEALCRARAFIDGRGGIEESNFFTRIYLSMFGQVPWDMIPWISCGLINNKDIIYRQGFPRVILIPYMVLYENRRVLDLPQYLGRNDAPMQQSTEDAGHPPAFRKERSRTPLLDRIHNASDREQCLAWIIQRQQPDGTWAGIVQVTMFSCMALESFDRPELQPLIDKAMEGIESYQVEDSTTIMQPFSEGPIMDTAFSLLALRAAGVSAEHPAVVKAALWLSEKQILEEGDWKYGNPGGEPGGWAFQFHNSYYPDVDDTTLVLHALSRVEPWRSEALCAAIDRGLDWLLSMQNWDGGFPVWDKNNWLVFNVLKGVFDVGDYSHGDITGRVLWTLGRLKSLKRYQDRRDIDTAIRAARRFLLFTQKKGAYWYGRWAANYTYGTGQVLLGLLASGSDRESRHVRNAVQWLLSVQNPDGGWGESVLSYETGTFEPADSTVAQSSSVLTALLAAGMYDDPSVWKGLHYLLSRQEADGSWQDNSFYAVNVPKAWYGRYELIPTQVALLTLSAYRDAVRGYSDAPSAE